MRRSSRKGFTLVEILVVVAIVLITSVVVLSQVLPALAQSQVSESARILQAALAGARDAAIRANAPRGIRLLPDATLTTPSFADATAAGVLPGTSTLAFSRIQQIELAPDYAEGLVNIGPFYQSGGAPANFPPAYPVGSGVTYPYNDSTVGNFSRVLMIEQSPYVGGFITGPSAIPNPPTSWYWNIRVGDQIRINNSGPFYTVVGPCTVNPISSAGNNTELFVNVGAPGTASPLARSYYQDLSGANPPIAGNPEFLFLVNGKDDDGDGYVDSGWDGFDNNLTAEIANNTAHLVDELIEWETETWRGAAGNVNLYDPGFAMQAATDSPSLGWLGPPVNGATTVQHDLPYTIRRRPVPVQGARETNLPGSIVIDATTWNFPAQERSRLPIDPYSLTADILVNADGQVVPQTIYSTPTAFNLPFYHFWLTERTSVLPPSGLKDASGNLLVPQLGMPEGTPNFTSPPAPLKGNRRLISMFTKSGFITTGSLENFDGTNILAPYLDAQQGIREATR